MSGFFFCGIIELPVEYASESVMKPKLRRRPQRDVGPEPAQVREQDRGRGEELHDEVAVGDRIHAVLGDAREAELFCDDPSGRSVGSCPRSLRSRAGGRRCARGNPRSAVVAREHVMVREQVMAEQHGLRALQVRVAGQDRVAIAVGDVEQCVLQGADARAHRPRSRPSRTCGRR
jgi:hypothetical protein